VQKYESGKNRVPAGRMLLVAEVLGVNVGYFYGLDDPAAGNDAAALADCIRLMTGRGAVELLTCFQAMNPPQRSFFLELGNCLPRATAASRKREEKGATASGASDRYHLRLSFARENLEHDSQARYVAMPAEGTCSGGTRANGMVIWAE
jgi:hypothetical protein